MTSRPALPTQTSIVAANRFAAAASNVAQAKPQSRSRQARLEHTEAKDAMLPRRPVVKKRLVVSGSNRTDTAGSSTSSKTSPLHAARILFAKQPGVNSSQSSFSQDDVQLVEIMADPAVLLAIASRDMFSARFTPVPYCEEDHARPMLTFNTSSQGEVTLQMARSQVDRAQRPDVSDAAVCTAALTRFLVNQATTQTVLLRRLPDQSSVPARPLPPVDLAANCVLEATTYKPGDIIEQPYCQGDEPLLPLSLPLSTSSLADMPRPANGVPGGFYQPVAVAATSFCQASFAPQGCDHPLISQWQVQFDSAHPPFPGAVPGRASYDDQYFEGLLSRSAEQDSFNLFAELQVADAALMHAGAKIGALQASCAPARAPAPAPVYQILPPNLLGGGGGTSRGFEIAGDFAAASLMIGALGWLAFRAAARLGSARADHAA